MHTGMKRKLRKRCALEIFKTLFFIPFALGIKGLIVPHCSVSSIEQLQICFRFWPAVHGSKSELLKQHFRCPGHIVPRAPPRQRQNDKLRSLRVMIYVAVPLHTWGCCFFISGKIFLLSKLFILVLEAKYMSEKSFFLFLMLLNKHVFPLWGHKGINVLYYTSLHKSLWEVKIDSVQLWLCPEISLKKNTQVPNLSVHIHHSKRLK